MIVLGIDPGTATSGWGVIKTKGHQDFEVVDFGLIETNKDGLHAKRLILIHQSMMSLLDKFHPDVLAVERLFFATNAKTAMSVGQAQGIIMFSAALKDVDIVEYAPGTVKKVISGDGRADKKTVQKFVRKILGARVKSKAHKKTHFDNAADALAVAVCHMRKVVITNG